MNAEIKLIKDIAKNNNYKRELLKELKENEQ